MGTTLAKSSSIINKKFLKSLTQTTPLKNLQVEQTQVHQIFSHSIEQHQIILEKIRIKKAYDCPYIIKILDSHTLQSQNLCSTVIKTYIVVEKPQSLAEEVEKRSNMKMGFSESQIWTLIYSCILGGCYFVKNNVGLARLNLNKIYIDIAGNIKINDPEFTEGAGFIDRVSQAQFIESIYEIISSLKNVKYTYFTDNLQTLFANIKDGLFNMLEIQNYIQKNYLDQKKKINKISVVATAKSTTSRSKQKKLRVVSGRKNSNFSNKQIDPSDTSAFTHYDTLTSYRCSNENKQNDSENGIKGCHKYNWELFTFKDPLKVQQLNTKNLEPEGHMFPKKALFGQRKKAQQKLKEPLSCQYLEGLEIKSYQQKRQSHTRSSHELQVETEPSLDGSQLLNIVSYQVDQQTSVREICQQKSEYILQLLNKCKTTMPSF